MKKYTIVYSEYWGRGSQRHSVVRSDRIETDNLSGLIATEKYDCNTHFIFEGWPKQEGEDEKREENPSKPFVKISSPELKKV